MNNSYRFPDDSSWEEHYDTYENFIERQIAYFTMFRNCFAFDKDAADEHPEMSAAFEDANNKVYFDAKDALTKCPNPTAVAFKKHWEESETDDEEVADIAFICFTCKKHIIRNSEDHDHSKCDPYEEDNWYCPYCPVPSSDDESDDELIELYEVDAGRFTYDVDGKKNGYRQKVQEVYEKEEDAVERFEWLKKTFGFQYAYVNTISATWDGTGNVVDEYEEEDKDELMSWDVDEQ